MFSPSGRYVVGIRSSADGKRREELVLYDTATGRKFGRLLEPAAQRPGEFIAYSFILGERVLASAWENGISRVSVSVRTWDLTLDPAMRKPLVALDNLRYATFAPTGDRFVTLEEKGVFVRDASSGAVRSRLSERRDATAHTVLSEDGLWLAVCFPEGLVVVLDTSNGSERERHNIVGSPELRFSRDASMLAAFDNSGGVDLFNRIPARSHVLKMTASEGILTHVAVAFSRDGKRVATMPYSKPAGFQPVAVWDVATGQCLASLPGLYGKTDMAIFTPDSRSLIISGPRSPRIWRFDPLPEPPSPAGHMDEAWAAAYSPDGKILATGSDDTDELQTIKLWDPATGNLIRGWNGGAGTVSSLAFSSDGLMLASGHLADRNSVQLWDVSTGSLLHALPGHRDRVRSVAFTPDGQTLATAGGRKGDSGEDFTIRLWDVDQARCVRQLEGHSDVVRSLGFAPDGRTLASASNDRTVRLWDAKTGRLLRTEPRLDKLVALAFAPDGATLAVAANVGMVTIHDATSLAVLKTIRHEDSEELLNLTFAPDGRSLATCGMPRTIRLWDPLTGQELLTLQGHKTQVNGIAFAPDGSSLASCSHDGEVKLWRAR